MKRALFWVHDPEAPSFRHRLAALIPVLREAGWECRVERFPRRQYVWRVWRRAASLREFDLLVIAKLKLESGERGVVRRNARRIVYDFDDAVYFSKPERLGDAPDRGRRRIRKFQATCAIADLVTAGNAVLAEAARVSARRVEIVPTGIETAAYPEREAVRDPGRIAWIGLPGNLSYLALAEEALRAAAATHAGVRLRVISDRAPGNFAAPVEFVRWSAESESRSLSECSIGIMPLPDDDWTRGKGGFKLLQYMAAGLPTIASPVGANREIVVEGETGFFAETPRQWQDAVERLLGDPDLRLRMGEAGRRRARESYDRDVIARRVTALYDALARGNGDAG